MQGHWVELVDRFCDLRGSFREEFGTIERSVDVARGYIRDLRFPTLLQELPEEILNAASLEADGLLADEADITCVHCPTVLALTFTAHALLHGDGEDAGSHLHTDEIEESCRRIGAYVLIEKARRMNVYAKILLPFDPWDDETPVICDEVNPENERAFKRWLGYTVD